MQLPGAMDRTLYDQFVASGRQTATSEPWRHSGRYSKVWFLNSRYERSFGEFVIRPRLYYNTWAHYHPVTGIINETQRWVWNLGGDFEGHWQHRAGTLVGGLTFRQERTPDSRKYQYGDVQKVAAGPQAGRIIATLSDTKGALAEVDKATNRLTGLFVQESWRPGDRWIVDLGMRYDQVAFVDDNEQIWNYDFATGRYVAGAGFRHVEKTYRLPTPKLAASYRLAEGVYAFGMVAQAGQVPSQSEFSSNPAIEAPLSRNHEFGVKGRRPGWQLDASVYVNDVRDEIVTVNTGGLNSFVNAGKTRRKGFELSGSVRLPRAFELGGYLGLTDYRYVSFSEPVRVGPSTVNFDRSGNTLPFIPRKQYGLFGSWRPTENWRIRLSSNTWGEYWLDNANTEKYPGWQWVTNLSVAYELHAHSLTLNVDNLADKHYAVEVKKDTAGRVTYSAAAPRTLMLTYRYDFAH